MKISIKSSDLAHYLKTVCRVPDRKSTGVFGHLLLEVDSSQLRFSAHNGHKQMTLAIAPDLYSLVGEAFRICVPAQKFDSVIGALPKDAAVSIQLAETKVVIASGRSRFTLATLPAEQFPVMEFTADQSKGDLLIPGETLSASIRQIGFCAARSDVRTFLNGIFFEFRAGTMTLAASDGYRMGVIDVPVEGAPMQHFILPSTCIEDVCQFVGSGPVLISTSGSMARFTRDGGVLHTKLIDGKFPDYRRLVDSAAKGDVARVTRDDLAGAIARVTLLSEGTMPLVRMTITSDSISVQSVGGGVEDVANEVLPCDYHAEPLEIGFNGVFTNEIIRSLGDKECDLFFNSSGSGTLLRGRNSASTSFVLMPARL